MSLPAISAFNELFPPNTFFNFDFQVRGTLAVLLVGLVCGAVGSLVVGNRMAFFSDALAHCAFAGVGLGLLIGFVQGAVKEGPFYQWGIPLLMVGFGILVGVGIAYVRWLVAPSALAVSATAALALVLALRWALIPRRGPAISEGVSAAP